MNRYKLTFIVLTALLVSLALCGTGCRRASHNGKIDGHWRIDRIEYFAPANPDVITKVETPEQHFIGIQLELMQLFCSTDETDNSVYAVATGIMSYDKKHDRLVVEFPLIQDVSNSRLGQFGVLENPVTFDVVKATRERLVLKTSSTRIICSKF